MEFKKILYPILLVLILISGLYMINGAIIESGTNMTISNIIANRDASAGNVYDVVQKNGTTARINITVVIDESLLINFTGVNITLPSNYSFDAGNAGSSTDFLNEFYTNDTMLYRRGGTLNVTNETDNIGGWTAYRLFFWTNGTNNTEDDGITGECTKNGTSAVVFSMNLTAQASNKVANPDLVSQNWEVLVNLTNGSKLQFNLTSYIDTMAPRISLINITDNNGTIYATSALLPNAVVNLSSNAVISNSSLTVSLTVNESNMDGLNMYYMCNSSGGEGNVSLSAFYENLSMSTSDTASPYLYTGAINRNCFTTSSNVTTVLFYVRDKAGWYNSENYTETSGATEKTVPFTFYVNDSIPRIRVINMSDAVANAGGAITMVAGEGDLRANNYVLANTMITLSVEVAGKDLEPNATMFYIVNTTSYYDLDDANFVSEGVQITLKNISGNVTDNVDGLVVYNGTIPKGFLNTSADANTTVNFLMMVNGSGNSYVYRFRGAFIVDGSEPTPIITAPNDVSIDVQNFINYKCGGTDGGSGVATCILKLTGPDGTATTYSSNCNTQTIGGGVLTGKAGTYTVDCTLTDGVGNSASAASKTFTVMHQVTGGVSGGAGAGAAVPIVDIDLTAADSATFGGYKGNSKTFTLGGASHIVTFNEVGETSVTITIESSPIVVTMNIGEIKRVDMNNDGIDDIEVTLNKIMSGKADITMKKLVEGASKLVEEEKAAAEEAGEVTPGEEAEETPTVQEEGKGLSTGVIVTIIVVVILLVVVGYLFIRKRS